jgi:hypothetical protein
VRSSRRSNDALTLPRHEPLHRAGRRLARLPRALPPRRRRADRAPGPAHLHRQDRRIVKIDEHVSIHENPHEPRRLLGRADLAFIEIRDRRSRELVTVIELLSPSNKRPGPDRDQYLAKRGQILASPAHLVEIDLLRGGAPMPADDRTDCDYAVLVSRAEQRPHAGFWPIGLRDRLPVIPVPLRAGDPDARLDLQEVLDHIHDTGGYAYYIYDGTPEPPLRPDDVAWARQFVPARS